MRTRQRVGKEHSNGFHDRMQGMMGKVKVGHTRKVGRSQVRKIH